MFLKFYQEIIDELLHGDALCILASGLGTLEIISKFVESHSNGQSLVLLLNASPNDLDFIRMRLLSNLDRTIEGPNAPTSSSGILQSIGGDIPSTERQRMYLNGGCLAMSSRVLVADMLNKVIPIPSIDGILVQRAERLSISTASNLNFALEIYRKKNRKGFIRGFSENAQRLCGSLKVTMQRLFVPTVTIWPRFRTAVTECLEKSHSEIDIVELHIKMTPSMRVIQECIMEIMEVLLNELKRATRGTVSFSLSVENGLFLFNDFESALRSAFKPHWNSLSERTHHLIRDLINLKKLSSFVLSHDAVTFYRHLMAMKRAAIGRQSAQRFGAPKAVWLLTDSAEKLIVTAKDRVYSFTSNRATKLRKLTERKQSKTDSKKSKTLNPSISLKLEVNPKWTVLVKVMAEIEKLQNEHCQQLRSPIVIVTKTKSTAKQLASMMDSGTDHLMHKYWGRYLHHIARYEQQRERRNPNDEERECLMKCFDAIMDQHKGDRFQFNNNDDDDNEGPSGSTDDSNPSKEPWSNKGGDDDNEGHDEKQQNGSRPSRSPSPSKISSSSSSRQQFAFGDALDQLCAGLYDRKVIERGRSMVIHALDDAVSFGLILWRTLPQFVVLYDIKLSVVRELEVFHSFYGSEASRAMRVYLLSYRSSVEEQVYLNRIRREKESFLQLIHEKGDLILPKNTDKKMDEEILKPPSSALTTSMPSSVMLTLKNEQNQNSRRSQRAMGGRHLTSKVIVDNRELRDSTTLPLMLYREGIEVVTATLTVGDYILSPDLCVERKCVPDLLSSMTHGRLYQQMLQITRYYPVTMLLIEFGEKKPFSLQKEGDIPQRVDLSNIISKMAILTIHFCGASVLWSRTPSTTTKIFAALKYNRDEPDLDTAITITNAVKEDGEKGGDVLDDDQNDDVHTPKDILRSLPGVNHKNVDKILAQCKTLKDVCSKTKEEILEMLGGKDGKLLYDFLHSDFFNE